MEDTFRSTVRHSNFFAARESGVKTNGRLYISRTRGSIAIGADIQDKDRFVLLRVNYGHTDSRNFASWNRMRLDATMGFQWRCFFHVDAGSKCTRCLIFYYSAGSCCIAKIGSC